MNPIAFGAFYSDFANYRVKQQRTPQWPVREVCKPQRSLSSPRAEYILMYHTLNTWKPGTCWELLQFWTKRFQRHPTLSVRLWSRAVEDGSKLTPLWGYSIISGFWFPAAKQTRPPGALTYPRLSLWTERAKFPTKSKIAQGPVYDVSKHLQTSYFNFIIITMPFGTECWLWKLKPNEVWWFDYIPWCKLLTS